MLPDIPLHPLVVHAVVVLVPVTVLAVVLFVVSARFRAWLGWGLPLVGVGAAGATLLAAQLGEQLAQDTPTTQILQTHYLWGGRAQVLAPLLGLMTIVLWLVTSPMLADRWGERAPVLRASWLRTTVKVVAVIVALAALVAVVLAGDAGSSSVWG